MNFVLGTVRLSFCAIDRALLFMGFGGDQWLIEAVSEDSIYAGEKARFLPHDICRYLSVHTDRSTSC
jgi:hypothetical protein